MVVLSQQIRSPPRFVKVGGGGEEAVGWILIETL